MIRDQVPDATYGNSYFDIEVKNPRTHIDKGRALYTDYEIVVKTNHPGIPLSYSKVRRRYSEFVWLRNRLGFSDIKMNNPPSLPGKQIIGRFKDSFLIERQLGLQDFLNKIVEVESYVMEPSFQLFLQTSLLTNEMDYYLRRRTPGCIRSLVIRLNHKKERRKDNRKSPTKGLSKEYPMFERSKRSRNEQQLYSSCHYPRTEPRNIGQGKERIRSLSLNVEAGRGGRITLPTIPGSSEDAFSSMDSDVITEEDSDWDEHPMSASWHGQSRDEVDFFLDEYEVIPLAAITQFQENDEEYAENLGYLDLSSSTHTSRELRADRFDY